MDRTQSASAVPYCICNITPYIMHAAYYSTSNITTAPFKIKRVRNVRPDRNEHTPAHNGSQCHVRNKTGTEYTALPTRSTLYPTVQRMQNTRPEYNKYPCTLGASFRLSMPNTVHVQYTYSHTIGAPLRLSMPNIVQVHVQCARPRTRTHVH